MYCATPTGSHPSRRFIASAKGLLARICRIAVALARWGAISKRATRPLAKAVSAAAGTLRPAKNARCSGGTSASSDTPARLHQAMSA
jgi:hypothetical protein